jgi:pilus assembly protein CpaE
VSSGIDDPPARLLVFDQNPELANQLRGALAAQEREDEVVECTQVAELGQVLSGHEPFDVLIAGRDTATPGWLQSLRIVRDEVPAMSVVLALGNPPELPVREVVGAGALDLFELPVPDADLIEGVDRAIAHRRALMLRPVGPIEPEGESLPLIADVYTIASASGGAGKTFFATNLAWFLMRYAGGRTCVIDLDLQFGEIVSALRLRPKYTIADLLQQGEDANLDLTNLIEEYTEVHESGIHVLAAPREPAEANVISPTDVSRVIEAAQRRFDHVVIDTPPALADTVVAAFEHSDHLYVMATLDVPSVRNLTVFLSTLERLGVATEDLRLVLNKAESDIGVDVGQVNKLFPQGFAMTLPYDREVTRSINGGTPVLATAPLAPVSRLLAAGLSRHLTPEQAQQVAAPPARTGFFHRKQP